MTIEEVGIKGLKLILHSIKESEDKALETSIPN
jgi:hypothetical protein